MVSPEKKFVRQNKGATSWIPENPPDGRRMLKRASGKMVRQYCRRLALRELQEELEERERPAF